MNDVIHGGVGNELMLIHYGGVERVDELHIVIKRQGVSGQGVTHWAKVVRDYGMAQQTDPPPHSAMHLNLIQMTV